MCSVGPHLDSYDVFLLQAEGKREWRLAAQSDGVMLQDLEFGVLANFSADETVLLEPGDMLYLPPEIAHHGIARGECMTWSIGFRAPDLAALLSDYTEWQLATPQTRRYSDADLEAEEARHGELSPAAIQRARNMVQAALDIDETRFARWFGCYVTEPKHWLRPPLPETPTTADTLVQRLRNGEHLERNSLSRFTFSVHGNILYLYFDGQDREFRSEQKNLLESSRFGHCKV